MTMKQFKIEIPVTHPTAFFVHCSCPDFIQRVHQDNADADISAFEDSEGGIVGNLIWISDELQLGSHSFIISLIHESVHFADMLSAQAAGVDRSKVASHIVGTVLSRYMKDEPIYCKLPQTDPLPLGSETGINKIHPNKISLEIFGGDALFLQCGIADLINFVDSDEYDTANIDFKDGVTEKLIGKLMWVSDDVAPGSIDFVQSITNISVRFMDGLCNHLGIDGLEVRAYTVDYIVSKILELSDLEPAIAA
jgi:hypothetical protein